MLRLIQVLPLTYDKVTYLTERAAYSSSLVALHLAYNVLRAGDASMAIVGGSNLILSHEPMVDLSMLRYVLRA